MKKGNITIETGELKDFLSAFCFMAGAVNGNFTAVDYFTQSELDGFEVLIKMLGPLVMDIAEELDKAEGAINDLKCNGKIKE